MTAQENLLLECLAALSSFFLGSKYLQAVQGIQLSNTAPCKVKLVDCDNILQLQ